MLTVTLLERVDRQTAFVVTGEFRPPASGRIEVPMLQLVDAERETGAVAVEVLGAGEVTNHEARGLDPADASELGDLLAGRNSPAIVAFRYRGDQPAAARALALTLTRYAPQEVLLAAVDEARYRALVAEDGKALVEGAPRGPQQPAQLPRAHAAGRRDAVERRRRRASGAARDRTEGQRPRAAAEAPRRHRRGAGHRQPDVRRHGSRPGAPSGDWRLTLPAIDLPVQQMGLTVHHSPRYRLTPMPSDFHVEAYEPPLSEALQLEEDKERAGGREAELRLKDGLAR